MPELAQKNNVRESVCVCPSLSNTKQPFPYFCLSGSSASVLVERVCGIHTVWRCAGVGEE